MIFRHAYRGGVWVDLEHPTEDEVRSIAQEFSISERLEMELFSPTPSSLVASDEGVTFLVLHFPTHGDTDGEIRDQEVDFAIGKEFIITVRYEVIAPLHRLQKLLEAQQLISPHDTITTDVFLEILFAHLYTSVRDHTSHVADRLTHIERDMFSGFEHATVRLISDISREFLHIEAGLANQEEPLTRFLRALSLKGSFGASFTERAERIRAERAQAARFVMTYRAVATELRETNASLLESRQNEIMKRLTIVNFIFLPLGLISWTFAMRTEGIPLIDSPYAFWIVLAFMFIVAMSLITFFIKKRWIF
ncbi:MAG: CorA family divalent cation transporter, partial [Patescibacteria group bacterium]